MIKTNFKKFLFAFLSFVLILSMVSTVFASDDISINTADTNEVTNSADPSSIWANTSLEVVENNICDIDIGGIGQFEKQITDFNATEKSVTLTLTVTNTKQVEESYQDAEIFFVIDNSSSMTSDYVGDITRKQAVINSANSLVEKLYDANPNLEIGIVGFSSLDSSSGETEGTINDASLRLGLTNSEEEVKNAIINLSELEVGIRTNIEAGLTIAQDNFSEEENKDRYIVLLTDGVPNNATDGTFGTYSGTVATRTKSKLEEIENSGIPIIAAMIDLDSETIEPTTQRTYRDLSEEIFGTEENPTTSEYFYIPDDELEDTIVNDIFDSLVVTTDNTLRNITITDYFPQEIIDNFNFEYVASPNIGTVSQTIDTSNNSITWNIELLSEGEVATLSYKLTLKEDYNQDIIDEILPTNTNVDITAENNGTDIDVSSDVSPTIRVNYEPEEIIVNEIVDNTVANTVIPQTGDNSSIWFIAIVGLLLVAIIARIKFIKNK